MTTMSLKIIWETALGKQEVSSVPILQLKDIAPWLYMMQFVLKAYFPQPNLSL